MPSDPLHHRLRPLLGNRFDYAGEVWVLIEILSDEDSVVLRRCNDCAPQSVQRNAYGIPHRRSEDTLTLSITGEVQDSYSQDLLVLLEGRRG